MLLGCQIFGRPALDESVFNEVYDHLHLHSRVAANRVSVKHGVPFRHLDDSVAQLYILYDAKHPVPSMLHCSESTFRGYVKEMQIFVHPSRDSDMCGHCQRFRRLRKRITALNRSFQAEVVAQTDAEGAAQAMAEGAAQTDEVAVNEMPDPGEESASSSSFHSASESSAGSSSESHVSSTEAFVSDDSDDAIVDDESDEDIDIRRQQSPHKTRRGPPAHTLRANDEEKSSSYVYVSTRPPNRFANDAAAIGRIQQFNIISLKGYVRCHASLTEPQKKIWIQQLTEYETLSEHRHYVQKVNRKYFDMMTNTPPNTLVLTMDFKQNLVIGNKQIERAIGKIRLSPA